MYNMYLFNYDPSCCCCGWFALQNQSYLRGYSGALLESKTLHDVTVTLFQWTICVIVICWNQRVVYVSLHRFNQRGGTGSSVGRVRTSKSGYHGKQHRLTSGTCHSQVHCVNHTSSAMPHSRWGTPEQSEFTVLGGGWPCVPCLSVPSRGQHCRQCEGGKRPGCWWHRAGQVVCEADHPLLRSDSAVHHSNTLLRVSVHSSVL